MDFITINLETKIPGPDEWREDAYDVECDYEPFVPGHVSGPPENCYPDEGGYADPSESVIYREGCGKVGVEISWVEFVNRYAAYYDIESDYIPRRYYRTAFQKAEERILYDLHREAAICHEEDLMAAAEAKAEWMRYDDW